jgi:hypothetical protein
MMRHHEVPKGSAEAPSRADPGFPAIVSLFVVIAVRERSISRQRPASSSSINSTQLLSRRCTQPALITCP